MIGAIPGVEVGAWFPDRAALRAAGVHRPTQAGICGTEATGAESVVISGGYPDDDDRGDVVIYTGAGGQDVGGRHVRNQTLARTNLALVTSLRLGLPVRVIRGAHRDVYDAPPTGYRYDGLYRVERYWAETGVDDFRVWRFHLERQRDTTFYTLRRSASSVRETPTLFGADLLEPESAPRIEASVSRIVRDTIVTREVKRLHGFRCQVCGVRVETPAGPYAEAAHIRPLGRPHDGPDTLGNVLCLCPTHHVAFDLYGIGIAEDLSLSGRLVGRLRTHPRHPLDRAQVRYRFAQFEAAQQDAAARAA